jgi:DNA invertase Pin-like site-specific DNA recombinase
MNPKITPDHVSRGAVVYVRQSTMAQVAGNLESQRRQYDLAKAAEATGFASVTVIDDDLGRSGSGTMQRPGFERLVAMVCSGEVGAVYCIEASRLARNGRDWHHLIDLCALAGALVIDPDGAYDPRIVNDRLLLGLKGTMSEYELSLMRQRGIAARDSKAKRGEFRFMLPPGFCWSEAGKIEIDPDQHVADTIRLVFAKFRELGSARQVFLWLRSADIKVPIVLRNVDICKLVWKSPAYHNVMQILHNPLYAGAYAFGRRAQRTHIVDGRARKVSGFAKPRDEWNVLLRDNHPGYISWQEFEDNQKLLLENAHMKKNCARKSARGGRALLTGLMRCGRCGRMMRVFTAWAKATLIGISVAAMMLMWVRDCASASEVCESIVRLLCRCWRPSPIAQLKLQSLPPTRSSARRKTSLLPPSGNLKRPATKHRWPDVDTNWWTLKNAMSLASWRHAGIMRWSVWPGLSGESKSCPRYRRPVQRSIVHVFSSWPTICRRHGMHHRAIRGPSSVSSISWFRRSYAISMMRPTRPCC